MASSTVGDRAFGDRRAVGGWTDGAEPSFHRKTGTGLYDDRLAANDRRLFGHQS